MVEGLSLGCTDQHKIDFSAPSDPPIHLSLASPLTKEHYNKNDFKSKTVTSSGALFWASSAHKMTLVQDKAGLSNPNPFSFDHWIIQNAPKKLKCV